MIAHLRGRLLEKHPNRVIVDVQGVGYEAYVPLSTFYGMGSPARKLRSAFTRTCAKMRWRCTDSRRCWSSLFERLIGVSGIGPKLALAVLSGIEPNELVARGAAEQRGAADRDSRRRQKNRRAHRPGAEGQDARSSCRGRRGGAAGGRRSLRDDLLSALINLGYHRPLAEKAVDAAINGRPRQRSSCAQAGAARAADGSRH